MSKTKKRNWLLTLLILISILFITTKAIDFTATLTDDDKESSKSQFALIPITGVISYNGQDSLFTESPSIKETIDNIKTANKSKDIKGIILLIDSPGGAVLASKDLAKTIEQIEKPNVAVIRQIGASGAYWAASSSDHIIADEVSMIGSIGVIGSFLNFNGFLENYNISYERLVAGKFKDTGSPLKEMTDEERDKLQQTIDDIYDIFTKDIAEKRHLSIEKTRTLATGEIFLGTEALEKNLIDQIGDKDTAIAYLKKQTNSTDYMIIEYKEEKTMIERLFSAENIYWFGLGMGDSIRNIKIDNKDNTQEIMLY